MKVYLDKEFKCHVSDDGTMAAAEAEFFDGKCTEFIEGYRFVPSGESWTREDGEVFAGEMIAPATDFIELDQSQRWYEQEQLADALEALKVLGVSV